MISETVKKICAEAKRNKDGRCDFESNTNETELNDLLKITGESFKIDNDLFMLTSIAVDLFNGRIKGTMMVLQREANG